MPARLQTLGVGTLELVEQADITFRKADYWTRRGYLRADRARPGTGRHRHYHPTEIDVARAVDTVMSLTVDELAEMVRDGVRGTVEIAPGVHIDLDVVCGGPPADVESVA